MDVFVVDSARNRVLKMVNQLEYDRQPTLCLEGGGGDFGGDDSGVKGGSNSDGGRNGSKTGDGIYDVETQTKDKIKEEGDG